VETEFLPDLTLHSVNLSVFVGCSRLDIKMNDSFRSLYHDSYRDWKENQADEFAAIQRKAFIAGFEAAVDESQNFNQLRQWLEEQRDEARKAYDKHEGNVDMHYTRYTAFVDVLTKLSDMGCMSKTENEVGSEPQKKD
jgi:hypothetical protein